MVKVETTINFTLIPDPCPSKKARYMEGKDEHLNVCKCNICYVSHASKTLFKKPIFKLKLTKDVTVAVSSELAHWLN